VRRGDAGTGRIRLVIYASITVMESTPNPLMNKDVGLIIMMSRLMDGGDHGRE
jgi:hypothetical protein